MNNFGDTIRNYREDNYLTQMALAEKLHVTRQTLSRWETGRSYPNLDTLVELSEILDVSLDFLLKGESNLMVEQISDDVRKKKTYKHWLFSILIGLGVIIAFLGFLTYGRQTQNEYIDMFNPFLKTKVGYAVLPKFDTKQAKKAHEGKGDEPKVDVFVADDPFGDGEWLSIYTGEYNNKTQVAMVKHKGARAEVNIIDKKDVPQQMKIQMPDSYYSYESVDKLPGGRVESDSIFPWK